jgi:predicted XRE-type DNA-binding protein
MPKSQKPEKKTPKRSVKQTKSSGNVFKDVGFPDDESVNLLCRADLMIAIEKIIEERGLSQTRAAKILGTSQPRLSDMLNGRIEKFTVDMLMKWIVKLGKEVEVTVKDRAQVA